MIRGAANEFLAASKDGRRFPTVTHQRTRRVPPENFTSRGIINDICAVLTIIGFILQLWLIDQEFDKSSQRKTITFHCVTSRYRQMIEDMDFGAWLYDYQIRINDHAFENS